ncbi:MAG TPA: long-chain fatty acid--CoA ligase [Anaerolineae bacterium]|nr:long-chain fatty acid--CoA ligase [Anaerolineae bacterium]HNU03722.1 long-chain fatty acid--CoA ligase [Anaerolineae bacterium]
MDNKPWLKNYEKGVPATLQPYVQQTLIDVMRETVSQKPDHTALYFKGSKMSYSQLDQLSDQFANALVAMGVKKGERVALVMPNIPQFVVAEFGVWKAGAVAACINPLYTEYEMEHALNECGAETAVVMTLFYDKVKHVQSKTKVKRVIATSVKEHLPFIMRLLFTLLKEKKEGHRITLQSGDFWFQSLLKQYKGSGRPKVTVSPSDNAIILFTGGTTGLSKAAVGSHEGLVMSGKQIFAWFQNTLKEYGDVFLTALPLFHVFANAGVQPAALVSRAGMALVPNARDIPDVMKTIEKTKATFFPSVPTMFNAMLNHPLVKEGKVDLTSIKLCISGASALLKETKDSFEKLTGSRIVEGYALTESMMAICCTPVTGKYKVGSIGMPVSDVFVRIADVEDGSKSLDLGEGNVGEIVIRAPQLMRGYWQRPDATAEMLKNGELFTGDLGYMDDDGFIFIVDRKKDVVKVSGFQVWPREVEEVLAMHPKVMEVAVAGIPDPRTTEAVKAWIVLRPGMAATADEIQGFCKEKLTGYKVPRFIEFRSELPKSTVGKVLRRELVREELEKSK